VTLRPDFGEAWNNLAALYAQGQMKDRAVEAITAVQGTGFTADPRLVAQIREMK
jgi:hypothetical protein